MDIKSCFYSKTTTGVCFSNIYLTEVFIYEPGFFVNYQWSFFVDIAVNWMNLMNFIELYSEFFYWSMGIHQWLQAFLWWYLAEADLYDIIVGWYLNWQCYFLRKHSVFLAVLESRGSEFLLMLQYRLSLAALYILWI